MPPASNPTPPTARPTPSSSSSSDPPKWQQISWWKRDEQFSRIPEAWRLQSQPDPLKETCLLDVPRTCGILTEKEVWITEGFDAEGLAREIREGRVGVRRVVEAFCKRAAIAHQLTNCLTEIFFEEALARAAELDAHLAAGKPPLGPLHGVPVSLKDTFKVKGYDASIGIAALCFKPATYNSVLVDNLLAAGAVLYCKTNVPQTLMALDSHNNVFGRTLNPANTLLTAGGSSGGEGALLALRGSVLGVGTDVGGSIRIPAMCHGLYGVKPSWARIPYAGQEGGQVGGEDGVAAVRASAGPLAHSARDIELFFRAVSAQRPWEQDPDVVAQTWDSMASLLPSSTTPSRKLRIGIVRRDGVVEPHPPIQTLLSEVASALQKTDIDVVELDITPLLSKCQSLCNALFGIWGNNPMFDLLDSTGEPLSPWLATRLRRKPVLSAEKIRALHQRRVELQTQFLGIWKLETGEEIDALVCPVAPHLTPPVDAWNAVSFTSSWVLLDYPAGVVPVRRIERADLRAGMEGEALGNWDKPNRKLWEEGKRGVFEGTVGCVQVVGRRLEERRLVEVMRVVDEAVKREGKRGEGARL